MFDLYSTKTKSFPEIFIYLKWYDHLTSHENIRYELFTCFCLFNKVIFGLDVGYVTFLDYGLGFFLFFFNQQISAPCLLFINDSE